MRNLPICLKSICIAIGFLSLNAVYSESETQPNVRNTHWYDTLEQVKENETAEFVEHSQVLVEQDSGKPKYFDSEEDVLAYKDTFHTKPIILAYHFDSICKQLYFVKYIINDVLSSDDANEIAKYLENKFAIKLQREQLDDEMTLDIPTMGMHWKDKYQYLE